MSAITTAVRVRPLSSKERDRGWFSVLACQDGRQINVIDPDDKMGGIDYLRLDRTKDKSFAFDHVFDETMTQQQVFDGTAARVINDVLAGANACVFAYGATGSGKTFTMMGQPEAPGVVLLTMDALFERAALDEEHSLSVSVQYVEIYNEAIQDLFEPTNSDLDVREAPGKGTFVAGASRVTVGSRAELEALIYKGNLYRTTESTNVNEVSSRSHAVLQLIVESKERFEERPATRVGKLSMIDLAGSERAAKTGNAGKRLTEGANINRSLLALANCINALADKTKRLGHVPYRDSKLTRLLKDSLGGHCKTVMITNVSPASDQFDETLNSLKYANRAKNIRTKEMTITVQRAPPAAEQLQLVRELRQSLVGGLQHAPPLLTPTSSAAANAAANGQRPTANGQRIGDAIWRHKGGAAAGAAGAAGGAAVGGSGARDGARAGARPATVAGPALRPKSVSTPTAPRTAGGGLNSTPNSARASGRDLGPNLGRPAGRPVHASPPSGGGGRGLVASPRAAYAGALIGAARADLERRRPSTADSGDGGGVSSSARLPATGCSSTSSPAASSSLPALPRPSSPSASPRQKQKRLPEQLWQSLTQNTAWAEAHAVLDQLEKEAVRELQLDPSPMTFLLIASDCL